MFSPFAVLRVDVSRITVVPGIGKRLGSSSQQELACHRCEWLGVGLYGGDQSFLRPGAGLGRSSHQPPALSLAWSEDSNRPRKERRIPSHEKPRWPLVQTAFVGQRCPCPARHARGALPVTHALPCWCVVTWLLSCFLVLPAESKASGVTSVIVEDLYVCPRQMLGFRGLSSV